jgi:stage V sporulation protein B
MLRRPNLQNFFYLVGSGLTIQLLGTAYRIWLAQQIGADGLGIFSMVYPVYRLISGIATIGLPLALTKWISEYLTTGNYPAISVLKKWATRIVFRFSLAAALLLYLGASFLSSHLFSEPRIAQALALIAPAIPFSALSALYRGYYQGFSLMAPTALSEVTEQIAEIITVITGLTCFVTVLPLAPYSFPLAGLTVGEIVCWATLRYFRSPPGRRDQATPPPAEQFPLPRQEILRYSGPLLLNQIVIAISGAAEGVLIPRLLIQSGRTIAQSTQDLGYLNGMAAPLAYFPLILLLPLGAVLSPQVSSGFKANALPQLRLKIRRFYLVTMAFALVCFGLLLGYAPFLTQSLYQQLPPAALLKILAAGMPFAAFTVINFSILGAIGASEKLLMISLWATGLKTALLFSAAYYGINGAAWAITVAQIFTACSGVWELWQFFTKLDA